MDKTLESSRAIAALIGQTRLCVRAPLPHEMEIRDEHPRKRRDINRWRVSRLRRLIATRRYGICTVRQLRRMQYLQWQLRKAGVSLGELGR